MKILALDSSAVSASAAVLDDDKVLGEFFINTKQTHSQTLMPMVQQVLIQTKTSLEKWIYLLFLRARLFYGSAHWCGM